jgi:hypothetical protein
MNAKVDQIAKTLEDAKATYDAGIASLKNNGRSVYSPEEESRRRQELQSTFQTVQRDSERALQDVLSGAEAELATFANIDPLTRLSSSELERANQLRPFISEDAERLPLTALLKQCQEAAGGGDKARAALLLRSVRHTLASRELSPGEGYELRQALTSLEDVFVDARKRDEARQTIEAAGRLQISMATSAYLEKTYGAQRPARVA